MFEVNIAGHNYHENEKAVINRPSGSGDYLFLFFPTPVYIVQNKKTILTRPNAIMIYTPGAPQYYKNPESGFINDWFHFTGKDLLSFFDSLALPLNSPFYLTHFQFIRHFVHHLELEFLMKDHFYLENIHALLSSFFIQIARHVHHQGQYADNPYMADLKTAFKTLRSTMLMNYHKDWSVDDLAKKVGLSRSRFSILYKDFFGVSPKEDLLQERFTIACYFLESSSLTVQEVAEKVGYDNLYHFSKQFKKRIGLSPIRYRLSY